MLSKSLEAFTMRSFINCGAVNTFYNVVKCFFSPFHAYYEHFSTHTVYVSLSSIDIINKKKLGSAPLSIFLANWDELISKFSPSMVDNLKCIFGQ